MHLEPEKRVYIVRHGSTAGNESNSYQHADIELSQSGRAQAQALARRFAQLPVDVIISSTMTRAQQTAQELASVVKREVMHIDSLREVARPSAVRGRARDDAEVKTIMASVYRFFAEGSGRYSDEENFEDLRSRAKSAIDFILARPERYIVVVSHGVVLRMLLASMAFGEQLSPDTYSRFHHFMQVSNTGISILDYYPNLPPELPHDHSPWKAVTINDHAHLGE